MEKVKRNEGTVMDWVAALIANQDKIIDWINEHEKGETRPQSES